MAYRPFTPQLSGASIATVATTATVYKQMAKSVARVATVAEANALKSIKIGASVASVATAFPANLISLRAIRGRRYHRSGVVWPQSSSVSVFDPEGLKKLLTLTGVHLSVENGRLVWWSDQCLPDDLREEITAHHEPLADGIGDWSVDGYIIEPPSAGLTTHHCELCERVATLADYDPSFRDGERWLCQPCFDVCDHQPRPERRRKSPGEPVATTCIALKHVARPDDPARPDWWKQPVSGWPDGKLIIANVADYDAIEIDLGEDE